MILLEATLEEKKLLPLGANYFLKEMPPFLKGPKYYRGTLVDKSYLL